MGLEKIRQTVLAEAKTESTRILEAAKMNNAGFLKAKKEETDQESDRLCKARMQTIEEEYNRKLIQLKGTVGKQLLDKRNVLLKSLFKRAKEKILAWPPETYGKIMGQLMERAAGGLEGRIRVHPDEEDLFQKVLDEMNKDRGNTKITLDLTAPLQERGGFIFVSANFEVDHTLDTMLKQIEYEMLPAIASELFSG